MTTESVLIVDLHVGCSLQMQHQGRRAAMSDCCQRGAKSGVVMPNGHVHWRCLVHEGMVDWWTGDKGETVFAVDRKVES